jgi:hypothetical protein
MWPVTCLPWRGWNPNWPSRAVGDSARQQQEMPLGGVLGRWTLQGDDLAALLPWLSLGQWLHLGKNATLGMGAMRLQIGASPTLNTLAATPA